MHFSFSGGGDPAPRCERVTASFATAQRPRSGWRMWGCFIALVLLGSGNAWAQDAFRASLAGQAVAEAKKQALENQRYNVKLGPVSLRLEGQLGLEATDNVRYTGNENAESDLIIRPKLNMTTLWRVTEKNSLNLTLGVGYDKYVRTTDYDGMYISPGSDLSFDMYVEDFIINLHSRFSYLQDVTGDPTISGTGQFSRFENTSGVRTTWDLNKAVLTAGYDHQIYDPTDPLYSRYSRSSELGTVSALFQIQPAFFAGLEAGAGITTYDDPTQPNYNHVSVGPLFSVRLSEYTKVRLAGGYVMYFIDATTTMPSTQVNAYYFDLTFQQRLGSTLSHSVSVGRQIQSGSFSSVTDQYYARYSANWRLFRKTGLSASLSYQNISDYNFVQSGAIGEKIGYYGLGLALSRPITRHLTGSLGYQFYLKDSNVNLNDYTQNRLALNLIYAF
jgi:hypothetical protein